MFPVLLAVAVVILLVKPSQKSIGEIAGSIQTAVSDAEVFFQTLPENEIFLAELSKGNFKSSTFAKLQQHNLLLLLYQNQKLISWTNNTVALPSSLQLLEQGTHFVKLKNGWYVVFKATATSSNKTLIGLLPVKYQYPFENRFLQNQFAFRFHVPDNIEVTDQKMTGSVYIKNATGKDLFGLYLSGEEAGKNINAFMLLVELLALALLLYYLHLFSGYCKLHYGLQTAWLLLALCLVSLRAVMIFFSFPTELYQLELFNPALYASSVLTGSLGDLVLNAVAAVWLVLFYVLYVPTANSPKLKLAKASLLLVSVFLFSGLIFWVFKTLVMDSVVSFEVYNVLSLSIYSAIGLFVFSLLLIAHFLFVRYAIRQLHVFKTTPLQVTVIALVATALFVALVAPTQFLLSGVTTAVWTLLFVGFFYFYLQKSDELKLKTIITAIAAYSLLTTVLIENLYERKERNQREFFAGKLVSERDYVAEYLFKDIAARIASDAFIKNYFSNPLIPEKEMNDRITSIYLSGYFNKYELDVVSLETNGQSLWKKDSLRSAAFTALSNQVQAGELHYISDSTGSYSYISIIPFYEEDVLLGKLAIELSPKTYYGQNVYPELLIGSNVTASNNPYNYHYAIYQNDKLVAQSGDYPYTYRWNPDYEFGNETHLFIEEAEWEHGIMRFTNGKKVIVTVAREPLFEPIATFSYIYAFLFFISSVLLILSRIIEKEKLSIELLNGSSFSFRTRINYSMLAMIIFSFIIIGIITISFFSRQYDSFYSDRLQRKEKVVHAEVEHFIKKNVTGTDAIGNPSLLNTLRYELSRLAEINSIDINLFDTKGELLLSSQPTVYDKGITGTHMNPKAFFKLADNREVQISMHEKIGNLSYLAAYATLRNSQGETVAYLGIPYFERSSDVNKEVSGFLVALMNVYVFLLICAAALAYFISNSVTRPLTIISEKLRILNLNKKNEPIEWKSKDEIGVLISEYNKMITELEKSAQRLARSERESAWREMAKQIAHEIKNPLTPMKLSIQYLQRAIDEGKPNIEELALRVSKTLEEQIENLSSIATAFSSFAKMPKAENEIINLNDLVRSICDLFNKEEHVTVTFTTDSASPLVFADKNQLVSVFNNLIKNATQSIPEGRTGFVDVNVKEEEGMILVTVSDNGVGIPKENYDDVFVPNFTTKSSGTGLGLAISKRIVNGAGGKIWFESTENVGTAFFVRLNKVTG